MSLRQTEDGAPVAAKHLNDAECWEQYFQHYRDYSVRSWAVICATGRLKGVVEKGRIGMDRLVAEKLVLHL